MLTIALYLLFLLPQQQPDAQAFYVRNVVAYTKYDARYILWLGNAITPPNRPVGQRDVQCLADEVTASGLYKNVKTTLVRTGQDSYRLDLSAAPADNLKSLIIGGVALEGFPAVKGERFKAALARRGIMPGTPFLKFNLGELDEKVLGALAEVRAGGLPEEEPWITIRPAGVNRVRLIVSPVYPGCGAAHAV